MVDFGFGAHTPVGGFDIFRAVFAPTGEMTASFSYGGALNDRAFGLAARSGGTVALAGFHNGGIDFGRGTPFGGSDNDAFVAKLTGQNQHLWSHSFEAEGQQRGKAVAMDDQGAVIVTGSFEGALDLGGDVLSSAGARDVFIARFAP